MIWKTKPTGAIKRIQRRVDILSCDLEAARRTIAVIEAERDAMASVIARDRARVAAETAAYARRRAESEGADGRTEQSKH